MQRSGKVMKARLRLEETRSCDLGSDTQPIEKE